MKGNRNQTFKGSQKDSTSNAEVDTQNDYLELSQDLLTEESRQESIKKEEIQKEHSDMRRYLDKGEGHDNARNFINMVFDDIESGREINSYDLPR
jgi:hypothetical protein